MLLSICRETSALHLSFRREKTTAFSTYGRCGCHRNYPEGWKQIDDVSGGKKWTTAITKKFNSGRKNKEQCPRKMNGLSTKTVYMEPISRQERKIDNRIMKDAWMRSSLPPPTHVCCLVKRGFWRQSTVRKWLKWYMQSFYETWEGNRNHSNW